MKQIDLREGARRQHRAVALLGALKCWIGGFDGLVFRLPELKRLLGLNRFKGTRVRWLMDDFRDFFPYLQVFVMDPENPNERINALLATRRPFRKCSGLRGHLRWCKKHEIQVSDFSIWPNAIQVKESSSEALRPFLEHLTNSDERLLAAYLSLLITGQLSPLKIPGIKA